MLLQILRECACFWKSVDNWQKIWTKVEARFLAHPVDYDKNLGAHFLLGNSVHVH